LEAKKTAAERVRKGERTKNIDSGNLRNGFTDMEKWDRLKASKGVTKIGRGNLIRPRHKGGIRTQGGTRKINESSSGTRGLESRTGKVGVGLSSKKFYTLVMRFQIIDHRGEREERESASHCRIQYPYLVSPSMS